MCSRNTTSVIGKIGLLLSLAFMFLLVSEAAAQCYCKHTRTSARKRAVSTRRAVYAVRPVRAYRVPAAYPPAAQYVVAGNENRTVNRSYVVDDDSEIVYDADYRETSRIAGDYGFHDGWIDGRDAGMERDAYHPENSGDFKKATNGYEDNFGSKRLYKDAYRTAYLRGYKAGFRSIASRETLRNVRNY